MNRQKRAVCMKRVLFLVALLLPLPTFGGASQTYAARGLVLKIDKAHESLLISCEKIPGYMEAMTMGFPVHNADELAHVSVGAMIEFRLVVEGESAYIEDIHVHRYQSVEQDPLSARRLKLLANMVDDSAGSRIQVGQPVPDFSLTDQEQESVSLSQFSGKVVVLTFTYTHCALPNFCFRIANHFRLLKNRFATELGRDLIFVTITFDPEHDTPEVMAKYGETWKADPASWKLLTGTPTEVQKVCNSFGISFWHDEGLMNHSLHTFVVDRERILVADLEGNEFSADQLGDLVQTVLARSGGAARHAVSR
jgi:protein SCO1